MSETGTVISGISVGAPVLEEHEHHEDHEQHRLEERVDDLVDALLDGSVVSREISTPCRGGSVAADPPSSS
jgi:hypothetical protein